MHGDHGVRSAVECLNQNICSRLDRAVRNAADEEFLDAVATNLAWVADE